MIFYHYRYSTLNYYFLKTATLQLYRAFLLWDDNNRTYRHQVPPSSPSSILVSTPHAFVFMGKYMYYEILYVELILQK